jgi:drug/metabolite transporter (DMT)-like permease
VERDIAARSNPRIGYAFAVLNAVISGVAVYVNSLGVATFQSPTLYTALKNGLVGVLLLVPVIILGRERQRFQQMSSRDWAWLLAVAVVGGSVPYALFFTGLKMTNAVTGSLGDHLQFALVAVLAVLLLKERLTPTLWAGLLVLLAGVLLGTNLNLVRWNTGTALILASTVLFAVEWVIVKHLLRGRLHPFTVMTAKMTLGSILLFAYLAARGGLSPVLHLSGKQGGYLVATGLILLCFTASIFIAIRHARVSAVMAIGAGAPLVTVAIQLAANHHVSLTNGGAGLLLTLIAVITILLVGLRQESRPGLTETAPHPFVPAGAEGD